MLAINVRQGLCKNCYACIRSCEVKATSIRQGQASIMDNDCLGCGKCLSVCPQHAREVRNDLPLIANLLRGSAPVWVSLAPAAALGPLSFPQWEQLLRHAGFAGVSPTAWGAVPATRIYEETAQKDGWVFSSACPAAVKLINRYFPSLSRHLAPVASPMVNHAGWLKQTYQAKVVFIGPCAAKKLEAFKSGSVDAALTFSEAMKLFNNELGQVSEGTLQSFSEQGLMHFPIPGGLSSQTKLPVLAIDGVDELVPFLKRIESGAMVPKGIVEISACRGSCLGGADAFQRELSLAERQLILRELRESANHSCVPLTCTYPPLPSRGVTPSEDAILDVLRQLGKTETSSEYNCGACGYHTCREKAAAVAFGRAELEMCLPYMRAKAESLSNQILSSTPSAVVVVNKSLAIEEWNESAQRIFGVSYQQAKGQQLEHFLPVDDYLSVFDNFESITGKKVTLPNGSVTQATFCPVKGGELIMGVYVDITQFENQKQSLKKLREETLDKAQEVINKQMRVAHEIASLLGETTAESKMLLLKLMKVVQGED